MKKFLQIILWVNKPVKQSRWIADVFIAIPRFICGMLPAMGFLWMAIYNLILGSGRFGLDNLIDH